MGLIERLSRVVFVWMGEPYVDGNEETWYLAYSWDDDHTNDDAIWAADLHQNQIYEAYADFDGAPEKGFRTLLSLAEQGSVWSMLAVADCFARGIGTPIDVQQSDDWYRQAAMAGAQKGKLRLAERLQEQENFAAAATVMRSSEDDDWPSGQFWLAWYRLKQSQSRQTYREIQPLLKHAADAGHPKARWLLARYMARGRFGIRDIVPGHLMMCQFVRDLSNDIFASAEARRLAGGTAESQTRQAN
jgi:TPR repeat protein